MNNAALFSAILTPLNSELKPDIDRFRHHAHQLLKNGIDGLLVYGTTGEANSITLGERIAFMEEISESNICNNIMLGAGSCAFGDAVELSRKAIAANFNRVLLLPPFYYKNISDDGLFRFFDSVIQNVGDQRFKMFLYHIPQISGVGISANLIEKLLKSYPATLAGIKDSGANLQHTINLCRNFPELKIYTGTEIQLWDTVQAGGAGCISATFNYSAALGFHSIKKEKTEEQNTLREKIVGIRKIITEFPVIPALKYLISERCQDPGWEMVLPPYTALTPAQKIQLTEKLREIEAWF